MIATRVAFAALEWETAAPGLRVKRRELAGKTLRLLEFSHGYDEWDWCELGHTGIVVEGRLTLAFDDGETSYEAGDALRIEDGPASRHRTVMGPGQRAVVFVTEDI